MATDDAIGPVSLSHPLVMMAAHGRARRTAVDEVLTVSCDDCVMRNSDACSGCVVSFVVGREPDDAVVFDAAEERAVRMLIGNGLVPELRHRRRTG